MAEYGFAPIRTSNDAAVELIAKLNVGSVVVEEGEVIGIAHTRWSGTSYSSALIPISESARLSIAMALLAESSLERMFVELNRRRL